MVIDFHTHCFPNRLAEKAMTNLSWSAGGLVPGTDGTFEGLVRSMRQYDVTHSVVLSIATNAHQQKSVNDFAAQINGRNGIISFGSVYPFAPDAMEQLEYIAGLGLKGIKFHPEYQSFFVDDERMKPIYRKISQLDLIATFHAGQDYGFAPPYHATPERILRAVQWFDSPVIAAHWGGLGYAQEVGELLCCNIENLWLDTSYGYGAAPKPLIQNIIDRFGTEKLLFASDTPWHTPLDEQRLLNSLKLSSEEMDAILYKNACKLLKIQE